MATHQKTINLINKASFEESLRELQQQLSNTNSENTTRKALVTLLKDTIQNAHQKAEAILLDNGHGRSCAQSLSALHDYIIASLYHFTTRYIYPSSNPSEGEKIALLAVGGYGRGTLAPYSDLDLQFLLPWKQTPHGEQVMEYILYTLWDAGLKVGHATRNIEDSLRLATDNMTIRTALLEARFLVGNHALYKTFIQRFENEIIAESSSVFIRAKLSERNLRHKKVGETRYLVEPNVKESKGGQRDLQTLLWICKYHYRIQTVTQLIPLGILSKTEASLFNKADDFLWAVRCHMHFLARKAQEKLSFDIQYDMAKRLGYAGRAGLKAVERFMKHYFLVAKRVGDLTRIVSAALEEEHVKPVPGLNQVFITFAHKRRKIRSHPDFIIDHQRINIAHENAFTQNPVNLIRLFALSDRYGLECHPHAFQKAARALHLITASLRENHKANQLFLNILTSQRDPALILRRMNESGVLGKFIPDFGKIVAMMQFNMYHHYTVDEHLLRCIEVLSDIENGRHQQEHPLASALLPQLKRSRKILYLALFLHDIAKGRPENHALAGEKIAWKLSLRFGLSGREAAHVAWLVREHLSMSKVAQSRDLNDPKTIADFAKKVKTPRRLNLLLILTICDIQGVGPKVWNGWKRQLLRTLYEETQSYFKQKPAAIKAQQKLAPIIDKFCAALPTWDKAQQQNYCLLHSPYYWLSTSLSQQIDHANLIQKSQEVTQTIASTAKINPFDRVNEITVLAPDHPRVLSLIAGACAAAGGHIIDAQIFTTRDGRALDIIIMNQQFDLIEDEKRRINKVRDTIEKTLNGKILIPQLIQECRLTPPKNKAFKIRPRVEINNHLSHQFSVIEVRGLDRLGLLFDLTRTLSDLKLNIASAHITTFGEKIVDSFYVQNFSGEKVTDAAQSAQIIAHLLALLK
ncbi:[protein-PII] uridylyltransferase [Bartonella sp. DGB2]|uniref:[protein-PII] uridylyltransferase n=1 Tax=Bartonella sp. DGB2 TaxID=3388426 RepID=UPI00398F9CDC